MWLLLIAAALAGDPVRGELLAGLGACEACHTAEDGQPYGGGYGISTPYGTFYGNNISTSTAHGIGDWSQDDFVRAMRKGRSPDGHRYYPAFPFEWFRRMTDEDLGDLWAYLQTVPAVEAPDRDHTLKAWVRGRWKQSFWRLFFMDRRSFDADPDDSEAVNRGRYLGRSVGHCGGCHTPRGGLGSLKKREDLAGTDADPEPGPDLTRLGWSQAEVASYLDDGLTPDDDVAGKGMADVIEHGTSRLSADDRQAIAAWVLSLEPRGRAPTPAHEPEDEREKEPWE